MRKKRLLFFTNNLSVRTNCWSNMLVKATFGLYLRVMYNIHARNTECLKDIQGPVIFVPNHTSMFDPFLLAIYMPRRMYFLTSEAQIRNPFVFFFSRLVGTLPISSGMSDIKTIRAITNLVKNGESLCIFPEGQQTWDGTTLPLIDTAAKMIRLLRAPVVRVLLRGSFSTRPRWAKNRRRGKILLDFKPVFTPEQLKKASAAQIKETLEKELSYNEWEYLEEHRVRFNNRNGTKDMEKALFMCPKCRSIGRMLGKGRTYTCSCCGYGVTYTNQGTFARKNGTLYFRDIHEWNVWQQQALEEHIRERYADGTGALLLLNTATVSTGCRMNPMRKIATGTVRLFPGRLEFEPLQGSSPGGKQRMGQSLLTFSVANVAQTSLQRNYFEFYYSDGIVYRFTLTVSAASSLKWLLALSCVQKIERERQKRGNSVYGSQETTVQPSAASPEAQKISV